MATQDYDLPPVSGTNQPYTLEERKPKIDLDDLTIEELHELRSRIDLRLPHQSLKNVNMERELVLQLSRVKQLQKDTLDDPDIPANQMAQVAGQMSSILSTLGRLQIELYDSERMKVLEHILIEAIKNLPMDTQEQFLASYAQQLTSAE